jgi:hypothetical protein
MTAATAKAAIAGLFMNFLACAESSKKQRIGADFVADANYDILDRL